MRQLTTKNRYVSEVLEINASDSVQNP